MKTKILKTLFVFGLWSIPYAFIERTSQITNKYLALGQMQNSETVYQMYKLSTNIDYINLFVAVLAICSLYTIWKPKETVK